MSDILKILREAITALEAAGVETPQLDAEVLLAHTLGCERHELYIADSCQLSAVSQKNFNNYIERRKKREPVAYIRGFKEFWSINIKVTPAVLIPRPETEALVEKALELLGEEGLRTRDYGLGTKNGEVFGSVVRSPWSVVPSPTILDLCTGSGCIAVALATEIPNAQITVTDISKEALAIARENLAFAKDRITFLQTDLFEKLRGPFDLIVSNPPYIPTALCNNLMPEVSRFEPRLALDGGTDGLDFVRKIRQDARSFLKPGGWLVIENGSEIEIVNEAGLTPAE